MSAKCCCTARNTERLFELGRRAQQSTLSRSESAMSKATCHQGWSAALPPVHSSSSTICFGLFQQPGLMSCFRYGTMEEIKEAEGSFFLPRRTRSVPCLPRPETQSVMTSACQPASLKIETPALWGLFSTKPVAS